MTLLFSIHKRYVDAMLEGRKRYEYRTRVPSLDISDTFLIYETKANGGRGMVVARALVTSIVEGPPDFVWGETGEDGGITRDVFDRYFAGRARAVAIGVEVEALPIPLSLPGGQTPPQSWAVWKGESLDESPRRCQWCSNDAVAGKSLCSGCLGSQRMTRVQLREAGLCCRCRAPSERPYCPECAAKDAKRKRERRAARNR